jgi:hypothetical protein
MPDVRGYGRREQRLRLAELIAEKRRRKQRERQLQIERARAQDVVEAYREAQGERSPRLEEQRRTRAGELEAAAERGPGGKVLEALKWPFEAMSIENAAERAAGPIPQGRIETRADAISQLSQIIPPGTPEYDDYVDQIQKVRTRGVLDRLAPRISRVLGMPEQEIKDMGAEGLGTILDLMRASPKPANLRIEKVGGVDEHGRPVERSIVFDPGTGARVPIPNSEVPKGGQRIEVDFPGGGGLKSYYGVPPKGETLASEHAKAVGKYEARERIGKKVITELAHLHNILDGVPEGGAILGALGAAAGRLRSVVSQLQQVGMAVGVSNATFNNAMAAADMDSALKQGIMGNSQVRTAVKNAATLVARMDNPGEARITDVQLRHAIERLGVSGDPDQWQTSIREVAGFTVRTLNSDADELFPGQGRSVLNELSGPTLIELRLIQDYPLEEGVVDMGPAGGR